MRRIGVILVGFCLSLCLGSPVIANDAEPAAPDLYAAIVIVTGRDNLPERERGFGEALERVLVRASGDAGILDRLPPGGLPDAAPLVERFSYFDRKDGIQISDEQGTRDRSFELTVAFRPAGIDALLAQFGSAPWPQPRPVLAVDLCIETPATAYRLSSDGTAGYSKRLSLADSADRVGLAVELPREGESAAPAALPTLAGVMTAGPSGLWDTRWELRTAAGVTAFETGAMSFDTAFDAALARSSVLLWDEAAGR